VGSYAASNPPPTATSQPPATSPALSPAIQQPGNQPTSQRPLIGQQQAAIEGCLLWKERERANLNSHVCAAAALPRSTRPAWQVGGLMAAALAGDGGYAGISASPVGR